MTKCLMLVFIILLLLTGCTENTPAEYTPDKAVKKGDVVCNLGNYTNLDKLNSFIESFKQGKKDSIRVIDYTEEGDALVYEFKYDGTLIECKADYTRDRFADESERTIKNLNFLEVGKEEKAGSDNQTYIFYYLVDEAGTKNTIAKIAR